MSYNDLSTRAQVARQRAAAVEILRRFPVAVRSVRLLAHAFNTTFRIDAEDGSKYALRINTNSRRSIEQVRAEVSWVEALGRDTDLVVPRPQRTTDGEMMVMYDHPDLERSVPAVMYSWLDGANVAHHLRPSRLRALGAAMATLHDHAERWTFPAGASLKRFDRTLMDSPNHMDADHELLTADRREVIDTVMAKCQTALDGLFARHRPIVIHGDLHGYNLKWHDGRLAVFDFDDTGIGIPIQDLGMAAYYFRDDLRAEETLRASYLQRRSLDVTDDEYEAIVAGRNLVLLNDLLVNSTAELRAILPRYAANSITKLRRYLDTGVYRHDVPGVIAAS